MSVGEKRGLLDALLAAGLPPERMMPGTGACAVPEAIELDAPCGAGRLRGARWCCRRSITRALATKACSGLMPA